MKNKKLNALSMKHFNRYTTLSLIRNERLTRADLARRTGLTRASITYIIDSLISDGLVLADCNKNKKKRTILQLNKDYRYALGIGVNRKNISVSVLDFSSNIVEYVIIYPEPNATRQNLLDEIDSYLSFYINKYQDKVMGIGITTPGPVDSEKGVIYNAPNLDIWHNFNICEYFSKKYALKCFLEKDINGVALVENILGVGKKCKNFVEIVADQGVGAGIIVDGTLYRGLGFGGELGHVSLDYLNGRPCPCGNKGCVEMYATVPQILEYSDSMNYGFTSWENIVEEALQLNSNALSVLDKETEYLSGALISCLNIMNIYTIVITGIMAYKGELFARLLKNKIEYHSLSSQGNPIHVLPTPIKNIEIIAPGNIVLDRFFAGELEEESLLVA